MSTSTAAKTPISYQLMTMCMIQDGDHVLLLNRPSSKGFPGFLAPGGKVEFPESLTEATIREVYEETGLRIRELVFKGIDEFMVPKTGLRYMVFNYHTTCFEGELYDQSARRTTTLGPDRKGRRGADAAMVST